MTPIELAADVLSRNLEMVKGTLADLTEEEMLTRPVPNANHAAWQIGHLIASENGMISAVDSGAVPALPEGFREKFSSETAKLDDPKAFPTKAELLDTFVKNRTATIAWARKLTLDDLQKPTPERMQRFAPTIGHMLFLMPTHVAMHLGQFQVLRRKLGRPVMF